MARCLPHRFTQTYNTPPITAVTDAAAVYVGFSSHQRSIWMSARCPSRTNRTAVRIPSHVEKSCQVCLKLLSWTDWTSADDGMNKTRTGFHRGAWIEKGRVDAGALQRLQRLQRLDVQLMQATEMWFSYSVCKRSPVSSLFEAPMPEKLIQTAANTIFLKCLAVRVGLRRRPVTVSHSPLEQEIHWLRCSSRTVTVMEPEAGPITGSFRAWKTQWDNLLRAKLDVGRDSDRGDGPKEDGVPQGCRRIKLLRTWAPLLHLNLWALLYLQHEW